MIFETVVPFYAWRRRPVSPREWDDAHLINAALTSATTTPPSATRSAPG